MLLAIFLYCSAMNAAEVGLEVPTRLDQVPTYCAKFLHHSLKQPLDVDLLSFDDWEHSMTLFDGWDEGQVIDMLLQLAGVSDSAARDELFARDEQELSALYAAAIQKLQAGWKAASIIECPISFQHPDAVRVFAKNAESVEGDFLRFIICRLGKADEVRSRNLGVEDNGSRITYLWMKRESLEAFQELFSFDLREGEQG